MNKINTKSPQEQFEEQRQTLLKRGKFVEKDCTVSMFGANLYGILVALPFVTAVILAFVFGGNSVRHIVSFSIDLIIFAGILILSIPVHEGLHALFWGLARGSFKGIRFGVVVRALTPFCACAYPFRPRCSGSTPPPRCWRCHAGRAGALCPSSRSPQSL